MGKKGARGSGPVNKGSGTLNKVEGQTPAPGRRFTPLLGIALVAVLAIGTLAYMRAGRAESDPQQPAEAAAAQPPAPPPITGPPANAKFGPHKQAVLPPLPFQGYPPARPAEVAAAVYKFAGEHPEVLGYVPCYCGCERSGHRGNDDCFVSARAANGDVQDWEPHGMT
jgi:Protein of unknown function with PCYCGC motif